MANRTDGLVHFPTPFIFVDSIFCGPGIIFGRPRETGGIKPTVFHLFIFQLIGAISINFI